MCGLPPEYCEWAGRGQDIEACRKWLSENHPALHEQLCPPQPEGDGTEETKDGQQPKQQQKKKKKVGFAAD